LVINRGTYTSKPTNVQWIAPSLTTFGDQNPSYRIYSADPETYEILDYDQYRMDLSSANLDTTTEPSWTKAYSFLEEYSLESPAPGELLSWA